jgi:hypothetical protein
MSQKVSIYPPVPLVSYAAWGLQYPHLNNVSSEFAVCLVSIYFYNLIRRKLTAEEISSIGEESMKECLELAISSMKNLENVK